MSFFLLFLAAAFLLYGIAVFLLRTGSGFYLVWFALAFLSGGAAVLTLKDGWRCLPRPLGLGLGAVFLAGFCLLVVTQALVLSQFGSSGEPDLDVLVILGSQVKKEGPAVVTRYRLDAALAYLSEYPKTRVIVSGGQGANEPAAEAVVMKDYLVDHGVEEDRVLVEDASLNTCQNIAYSAALMDIRTDKIGLVTNNFHVYRGLALAGHYGYQHVCGVAAKTTPFYLPNNMLRESFGIIKDFLAGNL